MCQRACEVAYEGECDECTLEGLTAALATGPAELIVLDCDGLDDHGHAAVTRLRSTAVSSEIPILAVGTRLTALDRWILASSDAFAVPLPARRVDVLATVIREGLSFAKHAPAPEPSHPGAHVNLAADAKGHLPLEAFLLLLAVAWQAGALPALAYPALVNAALENGHDVAALDTIEQACRKPIPLVDVDATDLVEPHRWYLYAFALWMSLGTGDTANSFAPSVQVLGFTLGISPRVRAVIQALVETQRRDGTGSHETFPYDEFQLTMLPELEHIAGLSVLPPPPAPPDDEDDVLEMTEDEMIDDALVVAS